MNALHAATAFALLLALQARGELPPSLPKGGPAFTVECRMVSVPGKLIPSLVPELSDERKITAAWRRVEEMIAQDEAKLTGNLLGQGLFGGKVTAESVEEVRYGTEFEPPQLPTLDPVNPSIEAMKNWPLVGVTPTAFDTRNVGQSLEIEVGGTADPKVLACRYTIQHVRFERFVKIDAGRLSNGERLTVEQPYFSVMKDLSSVTVESGQPKLIGVHRLPGPEGIYELFVLTVRLAPAGKAP